MTNPAGSAKNKNYYLIISKLGTRDRWSLSYDPGLGRF
jgi:hypothetical protein